MATLCLGHLPSLWKQHLLSEFAGLKQACPEGVFVSMNPGDPSLWSAVLFVRHGPYAPAVLRFHISFPDSYPRLPPLVTFQTDMFHPLITPLTTHMYTTDVQDAGPGGVTEQERLPPGGFSLRHGFPQWYRRTRTAAASPSSSPAQTPAPAETETEMGTQSPPQPEADVPKYMRTDRRTISTYSILKYIRSSFDREDVLDSVPLSATGNCGAWHAWRTHRRKQGKTFCDDAYVGEGSDAESDEEQQGQQGEESSAEETTSRKSASVHSGSTTRRPGEWNWDGVWEDRVKKGIASTLSESALYGAAGGPDSLIHFLALEDGDIETVKENLRRTLDVSV